VHGQVRNTNILVRRSSREKKPGHRWNDDKWILLEQGVDGIELLLCELQRLSLLKSVIQIRVPERAGNPLNDYQLLDDCAARL
jgi:hypothetical protein